MGVSTGLNAATQGVTQVSLSSIGGNHVVDCVLSSPVTIPAGQDAYVVVEALNCGSSEGVNLYMDPASDDLAKIEADREWSDVAGVKMAMDVIYTFTGDTSTHSVSEAGIAMRVQDAIATFSGEPISSVAVFDRSGRMVDYVAAEGRTEVSIDLCGPATGLYVVRVLSVSGRQKTFKLLNL